MRQLALATVLVAGLAPSRADEPPVMADPEQELVAALSADTAFTAVGGKAVRAASARYFEQARGPDIKEAFGNDHSELIAWLAANREIKETLFTAIDPEVDQVVPALRVFRDLWKLGPDKVKAAPDLAVAVAVVWDDPNAVYDYRGHQVRTKSLLPSGMDAIGPRENYESLLGLDGPMKTAVGVLPWEFLAHVVNHRTPTDERGWAIKNYAKRRAGIGNSYKDIEYDTEMLITRSAVCRLNGQPYTLSSIKTCGGVCAMQADFAARVAKSLAVPAEYVYGESNSNGLHAWVMWAEVKAARKDKVEFSLMSEGRYLIDQYYVGTLLDPKSGKEISDRDLERRLGTVGAAPLAARQAELLLRAFPLTRDRKKMTPAQQVGYLRRVLDVFPHSERAWLQLAELSRDGKAIGPADASALADRAYTLFQNYPDFSWRVFPDLLTPQKEREYRTRMYEKLAVRYEVLGRPDLACEARLKLVGYQEQAKDWRKAATGLAQTIKKFPAEGRYVPKMVDKMTAVCKEFKGGTDLLAGVYLDVLPKIPSRRGNEVSQYAVKMHEQAVEFFKANNKPKEAAAVAVALDTVKTGR
jgi:hypothetical protein